MTILRAWRTRVCAKISHYFYQHKIHLPRGFKEGRVWRLKHFGCIFYYWDLGEDTDRNFPRPTNNTDADKCLRPKEIV